MFKLSSSYKPQGDQPQAIESLVNGLGAGDVNQTLLGVTGSGKTFTMANVIQHSSRPALVMAHNKTLAAQLYSEMKAFFPENAVEYFVSYYDYYQPEAYMPRTDTYIEKEATINDELDRLRHSATRSLLERRDVIIVSSVSCLYGLGAVESYKEMTLDVKVGDHISPNALSKKLVGLQYARNDIAFERGTFRMKGDTLDIFPAHSEDRAWRLSFFGDEIESIHEIDGLTGKALHPIDFFRLYANSHYITPGPTLHQAIAQIKEDLKIRTAEFEKEGKLIEAQRIRERTQFDIEMMLATGACRGIENYSRYLTGRAPGQAPPTLFEYLPKDALLFVDESHVTVPQIGAMYRGDRARKQMLSEYGFRLPSCADNRPLKFEEWDGLRPQTIFVSATPGPWELEESGNVLVEQVIRPTALVDPPCEVRPTTHQVDDLISECKETIDKGYRVLVTTLTKKMSESLADYMRDLGLKVTYLHSDIDTIERVKIIEDLRSGKTDILVGINLLREGLDIPECGLVGILDADKEGFLRSKTSLVQTIGRAARNVDGRVILYADKMTDSLKYALGETERRRTKQLAFNKEHGITPQTIKKKLNAFIMVGDKKDKKPIGDKRTIEKKMHAIEKQMLHEASLLNFEKAAQLRDDLKHLKKQLLEVE